MQFTKRRVQRTSGNSCSRRCKSPRRYHRMEARQPAHDFLTCQPCVPHLTVILRTLAGSEHASGHRVRTYEFVHDAVHVTHGEQVIILAFGEEHVSPNMLQDALEFALGEMGETIKRGLRSGDVHALDDAPVEAYG